MSEEIEKAELDQSIVEEKSQEEKQQADKQQVDQQEIAPEVTDKVKQKAETAVSAGGAESTLLADEEDLPDFEDLGLADYVVKAIKALGFESPTPIQEQAIPLLLKGRDLIGKAQTGTGKTAAFALPILSLINTDERFTQALILEPTRELALQVAEALQSFAKFMEDFRVAPIYGGASYENQIRSLRHGAQVVVATPGRLIDLIKQGKLDLSKLRFAVIDEADEMLRMGFIDDVDWILSNTPEERQTALFSATMPPAIARIATSHLRKPEDVEIKSKTATAVTVHQRYWVASGAHKIDAMTRILEVETYDAVLVFVRTKTDAEDVANKLMARGFSCAALHGDIPQRQREKIIERVKSGLLDIIIATDVAARGLDVDRITHVFNYDIPYDAESYVHRIGRTGRAGRQGEAILFVSPRERRALRMIENMTHQKIEPMTMPTAADVNKVRLENFKNQVIETIEAGDLEQYEEVISEILADDSIEPETLAAALAKMCRGDEDLFLDESQPEPMQRTLEDKGDRGDRRRRVPSAEPQPLRDFPDMKMMRYRLAVGRRDGAKPGQIVGAIANEGNIESRYIGEISIFDTFTTVDLPQGMPEETMKILADARVCGRPLELREYTAEPPHGRRERRDFHDRPRRRFDRDDRGNRSENFNRYDNFNRTDDYNFNRADKPRFNRDRDFNSFRNDERRPRRGGRPSFNFDDRRFDDRPRRSGSRSERGFTSPRAKRRDEF